MMDVSGIRVLVDLLTLAHLHTSRAVVPLQVIPLLRNISENSNFGQKVSEDETTRNCYLSIVNLESIYSQVLNFLNSAKALSFLHVLLYGTNCSQDEA